MQALVTILLLCVATLARAADPLLLTSIKGFSAGMTAGQIEQLLRSETIPFKKSSEKPTYGSIYYTLGECIKKSFIGLCVETESKLTIGGAEVDMLLFYPESGLIEFQFDVTLGLETNQQKYSDAQGVINSLTTQHASAWEVTDVSCGNYGCMTTKSLHQGDGYFIHVSHNESGIPRILIGLSRNLGSVDIEDF